MQLSQGTFYCCAIHLVKTILNRVRKPKSFVYGAVRWVEGASVPTLEVEIQPRLNSRSGWSGCQVSCWVGEEVELESGGRGVPYELGSCVLLGRTEGELGTKPRRPVGR